MACNAQGQGTIKVVELTTPSVSERRMPALHAWDLPKSSALMINKRASSGYPNKRLVWLLCDWVIFHVSLLYCLHAVYLLFSYPSRIFSPTDTKGMCQGDKYGMKPVPDYLVITLKQRYTGVVQHEGETPA